jgi:hypothetical protein
MIGKVAMGFVALGSGWMVALEEAVLWAVDAVEQEVVREGCRYGRVVALDGYCKSGQIQALV